MAHRLLPLRLPVKVNSQATHQELADGLGYSPDWVRKWRKRIAAADPNDESVLHCQSHRPKTIPRQVSATMEKRIIDMRQTLSQDYNRTVGPRTIAAHLRKN